MNGKRNLGTFVVSTILAVIYLKISAKVKQYRITRKLRKQAKNFKIEVKRLGA